MNDLGFRKRRVKYQGLTIKDFVRAVDNAVVYKEGRVEYSVSKWNEMVNQRISFILLIHHAYRRIQAQD